MYCIIAPTSRGIHWHNVGTKNRTSEGILVDPYLRENFRELHAAKARSSYFRRCGASS